MRKLYVTHNLAELIMAWVQSQLCAGSLWMVFFGGGDTLVRIWFFGQCAALAGLMTWVFLFHMSGSRKRREEAKAKGAPTPSKESADA